MTKKSVAGDSWQRRRHEVSARIEAVALALFMEHGFEAVTVEEIAAKAGMSRRTFYRYFDSPDAILCAVLCRSMALWGEVARGRPVSESLLVAFREANRYALSAPENVGPLHQAMNVLIESPAVWQRIMGPVQLHMAERYEVVIAARLKAQHRSTKPAGPIAAGLAAILMHLSQESLRQGKLVTPARFARVITVFCELLKEPDE